MNIQFLSSDLRYVMKRKKERERGEQRENQKLTNKCLIHSGKKILPHAHAHTQSHQYVDAHGDDNCKHLA